MRTLSRLVIFLAFAIALVPATALARDVRASGAPREATASVRRMHSAHAVRRAHHARRHARATHVASVLRAQAPNRAHAPVPPARPARHAHNRATHNPRPTHRDGKSQATSPTVAVASAPAPVSSLARLAEAPARSRSLIREAGRGPPRAGPVRELSHPDRARPRITSSLSSRAPADPDIESASSTQAPRASARSPEHARAPRSRARGRRASPFQGVRPHAPTVRAGGAAERSDTTPFRR